jgi:hypothetical protein
MLSRLDHSQEFTFMDQVSSSSFNFMGPYLSGPESFLLVKNTFFCARPNGSPNFKVLYRIYSVYLFPLVNLAGRPRACYHDLPTVHFRGGTSQNVGEQETVRSIRVAVQFGVRRPMTTVRSIRVLRVARSNLA